MQTPQLNLLAAWSGILLGFISGLVFGLFFHREGWLGGYSSLKRRLYRLGHISFFGLAIINLMFYFSVKTVPLSGPALNLPSCLLLAGAVTMPLCCFLMAHVPRLRMMFSIPVTCLVTA